VQDPIFGIGAVARTLELPAATIRTWESRYGLVVPRRTSGGQRLYTREQVDQLRFVKRALERGARPGEAHRLLAERLAAGGDLDTPEVGAVGTIVVGDVVLVGVANDADATRCAELHARGTRVVALVDSYPGRPSADAVLDQPVRLDDLVEAVRALGGR
jgi:DNA-binding transcriptional MerR regulator